MMLFGWLQLSLRLLRKMLSMGNGKAAAGLCSAAIHDSLHPSEGFAAWLGGESGL